MGKSSSSSRKKDRSKPSSSQRSRRKNRSRKLKSKKLRRRHDSPSCSDADIESSTSVSSSSLEGDKRKGRSRSGKDVRAGKRKAEKRSHNRQSRDYSPNRRKRKHSKRDGDLEVRKTFKKKKRRRDLSISATSGDSLSCSTCQDGSTKSNESEIDRHRGRSGKRKRNLGKTESYRSKSRSPCSLRSEGSDYQIEDGDNSFVEKNYRRLRSVIVVAGEQHLEEFNGDQQQEEIIYHSDDDQPSFRNTDSNDGTSNRELNHVASKDASKVENEKEVFVLQVRKCLDVKDHEDYNMGNSDNHGGVINDYSLNERKNECPGNIDSVNGTDLESILRKRALENLKRFKSVPQKNVETPANRKVDHNNDVKQLHSSISISDHVIRDDAEVNGVEFSGQDGESVVNTMMTEENGAKSTGPIDLVVESMQPSIYSSHTLGKMSDGDYGSNELKDCTSLDQEVVNNNSGQKADAVICSTTNRSNLVIAASRPQSKVDFPIMQASASLKSIQEKPSKSDVNVDETAQILAKVTNDDDENTGNGFGSSAPKPSSSLKSIPGGNSINKSGHTSEESSQFEQKTMSVMRGGEMVQVNYKVYIPKRAPALTRRHIKR